MDANLPGVEPETNARLELRGATLVFLLEIGQSRRFHSDLACIGGARPVRWPISKNTPTMSVGMRYNPRSPFRRLQNLKTDKLLESANPLLKISFDFESKGGVGIGEGGRPQFTADTVLEVYSTNLAFNKLVYDPASKQSGYAVTDQRLWLMPGHLVRSHGGASSSYLLELPKAVDSFITHYLRINEKACKARK